MNRRCVSLALAASPSRSTIHLRRPRSVLPILPRPGPISELLGDELAMNPRQTALHSPGCVEVALSELRMHGVLGSSRRSEPSRGRRGRTCSPSWEEFAHGEQQAHKREYDEHDLVDVVFAGRQPAREVRRPEERVIPQGEPGPPLAVPVGDRGDQEAEQAHPDRRHSDRSQVRRTARSGQHGGGEAEDEDGDADDREREPSDRERDAGPSHVSSFLTLPRVPHDEARCAPTKAIHPSTWKVYSTNFAQTEFSEGRIPLAWYTSLVLSCGT